MIAHRGDRVNAPENTMPAFERAAAVGADAFECDVRLTEDGHVVVIHDDTVDRTTNGTGAVHRMPLGALRELDAGARWTAHADPARANAGVRGEPTPFASHAVRIPLLSELLDAFPRTPVLVECKTVAVAARAVGVVVAHGASDRVLFGAFPGAALAIVRNANLATIATRAELMRYLPGALLRRSAHHALPFGAIAMPPSWRGIPLPVVGYARTLGVPVHVWTVNEPAVAISYWRDGINGILTDDPARILAARAAAKSP